MPSWSRFLSSKPATMGSKCFWSCIKMSMSLKCHQTFLRISLYLRLKFYNLIYCSDTRQPYSLLKSAPLEVILRVSEKWFCKLENFLWVSNQKKIRVCRTTFLRLEKKIWVCRTTFLPPSKSLLRVQIKRLLGDDSNHSICLTGS